jgi:hypothetical protein
MTSGAPGFERNRMLLMPTVKDELCRDDRMNWISVSSSVQLIADSDSLESARKAFAQLSQEAIRLADRHPEYLILRCPTDCPDKCANCRSNEFGSWVQIDTAVGNPFMGTASPDCGARIQ